MSLGRFFGPEDGRPMSARFGLSDQFGALTADWLASISWEVWRDFNVRGTYR
jgi:hypothetical protein